MLTDNWSKVCVTILIVALVVLTGVLAWHGTLGGADVKEIIFAVLAVPAALFAGHTLANTIPARNVATLKSSNESGPPQT